MKHSSILTTSLIAMAMLLTGGCSTPQDGTHRMSPYAQSYLQKASTSSGVEKQQYEVLAAEQLLTDDDVSDAQKVLKKLDRTHLGSTLQQQKLILNAQLALKQNNPTLTLSRLHQIHHIKQLPHEIQSIYYQTASEAYLRSNHLAKSTIARIHFDAILQELSQEKSASTQTITIWRNLQSMTFDTLNNLMENTQSPLVRGWLQLAMNAKQNANHPTQLIADIQEWQQSYPEHPANQIIPNTEQLDSVSQSQMPQHIALLLPLTGQFARTGQAVRDGFLTAFYNDKNATFSNTTIRIYDTHTANEINALYQQAVTEGAEFIIGPLTKNKVTELSKNNEIQVPTLALNYLSEDAAPPKNLMQFGLSPAQATTQAIQQCQRLGMTHVLIMTPDTNWADNIKQNFTKQWKSLGETISDSITFSYNEHLADEISSALHTDQSKERALKLKHTTYSKIKATIRRRQDINGIFLVAKPRQARQIQPLLKFYYAGNLPIVSISNIYAGYKNQWKDRDLNGIYFNDMPWLLSNTPYIKELKQAIKTLWPTSAKTQSRFYGLGVDAYALSRQLPRLIALPNFAVNGVTGQLYLTDQQTIYRQLVWARFVKGIPTPIK